MPGWMKWGISLLVGFGIIVIGFRFAGWLLTTFFVMNCLVLIIVVLLQSGKAADLAGAFGGAGSQTAFGPRGAATILSQATTWCAIMFMVCAMALVLRVDRSVGTGGSVIYNTSKPASKPAATPAPVIPAPTTPTPATQQPQQQAPATAPQQQQPQQQAPTQTPPRK
ncbi:MAG TPA: preprotein translocase subunit SecG [Candidatus Acidoferrum sp.]|nr:preprotein translocase subunit SecG [Candidatus Acidoferrum sp.]